MLLLLTGISLGLILVLAMIMLRDYGVFPLGKVFVLFLFLVSIYLLHPYIPEPLRAFSFNLWICIPATFWWLCYLVMDRRPSVKSVFTWLAVYSVAMPWFVRGFYSGSDAPEFMRFLAWDLAQYCEYIILVHGFSLVWRNWKDDLVETRRQLGLTAMIVLGIAVAWAVLSMNLGFGTEYTRIAVVLIPGLTVAYFLLQGHRGMVNGEPLHQMTRVNRQIIEQLKQPTVVLKSVNTGESKGESKDESTGVNASESQEVAPELISEPVELDSISNLEPKQEQELKQDFNSVPSKGLSSESDDHGLEYDAAYQRLESVMQNGFYRTENLTVKQLAKSIDFPEYKTRRLINQRLNYRNFNDYINTLRIEEACLRLKAEPDTPVLNIALDIGYRSLSSFNRAFKSSTRSTPTEYRQSV